jgi:hypothetical protein
MSYNPTTDFIGLSRLVGSSIRSERMPGLDYVVAALARMGFINLSVGQTAPTSSQANTVWLQPAIPSWAAEGTLWLWNSVAGAYQVATPALWIALLAAGASTGPSRVVTASGGFVMSTADAGGAVGLNRAGATPGVSSTTLPAGSVPGMIYAIEDLNHNFQAGPVTVNYPAGTTGPGGAANQVLSINGQCAYFRLYADNIWSFRP